MKKIILYGLQRSGTNYLETLIQKNFQVTFENVENELGHMLRFFMGKNTPTRQEFIIENLRSTTQETPPADNT